MLKKKTKYRGGWRLDHPFPAKTRKMSPKKLSGLHCGINLAGKEELRAKTREEKEADFKHFA